MKQEQSPDAIRSIIKRIVWDYNLDPYDLYLIASRQKEAIGPFNEFWVWQRMFERLGWYDLLKLYGIETVKVNLTREHIQKIRIPELRERYERVRCLLHGEALPPAEWGAEARQRMQSTLLSDRWYRHLPPVLPA